ncbi:hypothetical protein [Streptomyces griseosporeus]|uniref:hypothetical protein n=1 Tax=Streptomyces griseosporeus TaxID=1910 RepID=UPI00167CBD52|nr:hypothetical protein [Streptomyces griseosporeus]
MTTIAAPVAFSEVEGLPCLEGRAAARRLVQRGDTELIVQRLDPSAKDPVVRFPAPWPRRFGGDAVSPAGDVAVFAGPHALQAVDRSGSVCGGNCGTAAGQAARVMKASPSMRMIVATAGT